ncbi:MAG: hypothetical protein K2K91_10935 [Ruminococcus sp.]|nr:hypothetical protein [Ruminococcus sp.]
MPKVLNLFMSLHCEPYPYCGYTILFITESKFAYCRGCHRNIRVYNGTLAG